MTVNSITISGGGESVTMTETEFNQIAENARKGRPKMKDDPDWSGHNSKAYSVTASELRAFIERVERLNQEKADIAEQTKEVFAEAKGRGFDAGAIRKLIALRKQDPDRRAEDEAVLELYKDALGM